MAEGYIQDKLRQSETLNIDELMQDFHTWQEDVYKRQVQALAEAAREAGLKF